MVPERTRLSLVAVFRFCAPPALRDHLFFAFTLLRIGGRG